MTTTLYQFGPDSFRDRLINQSVTQLLTLTRHCESGNHALFSSCTNLGSKIWCTFLDKTHFETDSLINLLHVSVFTRHWESRNDAFVSYCTYLGWKMLSVMQRLTLYIFFFFFFFVQDSFRERLAALAVITGRVFFISVWVVYQRIKSNNNYEWNLCCTNSKCDNFLTSRHLACSFLETGLINLFISQLPWLTQLRAK